MSKNIKQLPNCLRRVTRSLIRLFRIISIPSKFCYFPPPDHVISMGLLALNFRCQMYTTNTSIDVCRFNVRSSTLKKILTFAVKDRYQLHYFICIKLKTSMQRQYFFKKKMFFFLYLRFSASKENDLPLCIIYPRVLQSRDPKTILSRNISKITATIL